MMSSLHICRMVVTGKVQICTTGDALILPQTFIGGSLIEAGQLADNPQSVKD